MKLNHRDVSLIISKLNVLEINIIKSSKGSFKLIRVGTLLLRKTHHAKFEIDRTTLTSFNHESYPLRMYVRIDKLQMLK